MKPFKVLFMLIMLVTFSTGFGKTTADLKQNSKTELVQSDVLTNVSYDFVNVVSFEITAVDHVLFFENKNIVNDQFVQDNFKTNPLAIISDEGWRNSRNHYKNLQYKEKLLDSCQNAYKNKLVKNEPIKRCNIFPSPITIRIRNDS